MLETFKQYLITEKVNKTEYEQIINDSKFNVGIEFEYIDNEVLRVTAGEFDFDMLSEAYLKFIRSVTQMQQDSKEMREQWLENQRSIISKTIKDLQGKLEDDKDNEDLADQIDTLEDALSGSEFFDLEHIDGLEDLDEEFDLFAEDPYFKMPEIPEALVDFWSEVVEDDLGKQAEPNDIREAITQAVHEAVYDDSDFDDKIMPKEYNMIEFQHFDPKQVSPSYDSIENGFNFEDFPYKNYLIGGYNQFKSQTKKWRIETDESLKPRAGGLELITPITTLNDSLNITKTIFNFIQQNGYTNASCGLHANMSYKGFKSSNLDVFKMMIFMEEGFIFEFFPERDVAVEYLRFTYQVIAGNTALNNDMLKDFNKGDIAKAKSIMKNAQNNLLTWMQPAPHKVNGINILNQRGSDKKKGKDGYIEFRYIGGTGYEKKYTQVRLQLLRYAYLLKLGMEPNFKKREYISKVSRMIETYGEYFPKTIRPENLNAMKLLVTDTKTNDVYMINDEDDDELIVQYTTNSIGKKEYVGKISKEMLMVRMRNNPKRYVQPPR